MHSKLGTKREHNLFWRTFFLAHHAIITRKLIEPIPIACLFTETDLTDMHTLNPIQPIDRRITRAYAKKMGISVPELFPDKPQTNKSCEQTPVTNVTPPSRPTNPLTSQSHHRPIRDQNLTHPRTFPQPMATAITIPLLCLPLDSHHLLLINKPNLDSLTDKVNPNLLTTTEMCHRSYTLHQNH